MQYTASLRLLCDLVRKPEEFYLHFPRFPAGLIFTMSFGSRLADDGRDLAAVQKILMDFVIASNPGAHLVDSFPILDKLPDFLSPWRHQARAAHQEIIDVRVCFIHCELTLNAASQSSFMAACLGTSKPGW
jgi:hypothetical protein